MAVDAHPITQDELRFELGRTQDAFRAESNRTREEFRDELSRTREDFLAGITQTRDEIRTVREEFGAELSHTRDDLRTEMSQTRDDLRAEMSHTREELRAEMSQTRDDFRVEMNLLRTEIVTHYATKADLHSLESRLVRWMIGSVGTAVAIAVAADRLWSLVPAERGGRVGRPLGPGSVLPRPGRPRQSVSPVNAGTIGDWLVDSMRDFQA